MNQRNNPLVSVVITTYGHQRYIAQCLESVLDQGMDDIEVIVVDDASPDETAARVQPFTGDPRVTYVRNPANLGSKKNNGRALQMGRGKYVVWMHGDDFMLPGHLSDALEVLEHHPHCALAYSPCYWVDEGGRILTVKYHPGHLPCSYAGGRNEFAGLLAHDNYITPSSAVMRRSALEAVGTIDQDPAVTAGDWDLFVRLAARHPHFAFIARPSTGYRIHPGQVSRDFYADDAPLKAHVGILEKALGSPHSHRLGGWERPVAEQLRRRLAAYPGEVQELYRARVDAVAARLAEMSGEHRGRGPADRPKVSVIVPTMNRPELLQDALRSLLDQSYEHWEAVVVNDAGLDVSALVETLDDKGRIRCVRHQQNRGLAAARNTGLRLSDGDIVCYLDDDDRFYPQHLERVVAALQARPECGCVYTEAQYVFEEVDGGRRRELGRDRRYGGLQFSLERLRVGNYIPVNAWAHRRWLLGEVGWFDEDMPALEDWEMLLRIAETAPVHHIDEVTVEVRERGGASRLSRSKRQQFPELTRRVYARHADGGSPWVAEQRRLMLQHLEAEAVGTAVPVRAADPAYDLWCAARGLTEAGAQLMAERMVLQWRTRPAIHLLMAVGEGDESALAATLHSLTQQLYPGWGLTVLAAGAAPAGLFEGAANVEWLDTRGTDAAAAANAAVAAAGADWVGVIAPGDRLAPQALFGFVDYLQLRPHWRAVYCDSDRIDAQGRRSAPRFCPDFNPELLRAQPYFGDFCLVRRAVLEAGGGLRHLPHAAGYDAVLRVYEAHGRDSVGHIPDVLLHSDAARAAVPASGAQAAVRQALAEHLQRCGESAAVLDGVLPGSRYIEYRHPSRPMVSILLNAGSGRQTLPTGLQGLLDKTGYPNFEVVVVDAGGDAAASDLLRSLAQRDGRVRVVPCDPGTAGAAGCNRAAREARGEYLLLLRADAQVLHGDWLDRMMAHAQRPTVGVVGARLLSPEGRVEQAGLILGMEDAAGRLHAGLPGDAPGHLGRAQVAQNLSAVSGDCLLIRRALFVQAGGLDTRRFTSRYHDVDLCLKAGELGYQVIWTPHAALLVQPDAGAPGAPQDALALMQAWLPRLAEDPAYNRHLSLRSGDCTVDGRVMGWNPDIEERLRVSVVGAGPADDDGPAQALRGLCAAAQVQVTWSGGRAAAAAVPTAAELARLRPDVLLLRNPTAEVLQAVKTSRRVLPQLTVMWLVDDAAAAPAAAMAAGGCDRLIVADGILDVWSGAACEIARVPAGTPASGPQWLAAWLAALTPAGAVAAHLQPAANTADVDDGAL